MKKILFTIVLLSFTSFCFSEEPLPLPFPLPPVPVAVEQIATKPKLKDYETALDHAKKWSNNVDNESFYKDAVLRKEPKLVFQDLSADDKVVFMLWQAGNLSNALLSLESSWQEELDVIKKAVKVDPDSIKQTDIEKCISQLHQLRKDNAVRTEAMIESTSKKLKGKISQEEIDGFIKKMHDWNDQHKLIERKSK